MNPYSRPPTGFLRFNRIRTAGRKVPSASCKTCLAVTTYTVVGDTLFYARRFESSLTPYRKCLELDPTFGAGHTDLARSLEQLGRTNEAIVEFERGTAGPDGLPQPSSGLAFLYARAGRLDDARATMQAVQELETGPGNRAVGTFPNFSADGSW
jgi:Flp pilus assembly protein TadD